MSRNGQNYLRASSSDEIINVIEAPACDNSQKKCGGDLVHASSNSKIKRIKGNDPARWSFAWGPPV